MAWSTLRKLMSQPKRFLAVTWETLMTKVSIWKRSQIVRMNIKKDYYSRKCKTWIQSNFFVLLKICVTGFFYLCREIEAWLIRIMD